jgi:hypothetical protein
MTETAVVKSFPSQAEAISYVLEHNLPWFEAEAIFKANDINAKQGQSLNKPKRLRKQRQRPMRRVQS